MSSTDHSDDLQLERDLPTTEADIVALRQLRHDRSLPLVQALELLSNFDLFPLETSDRIAAEGWKPFRL